MYFVPHFGHAKVYETSIWTPCFQISAKTLPWLRPFWISYLSDRPRHSRVVIDAGLVEESAFCLIDLSYRKSPNIDEDRSVVA